MECGNPQNQKISCNCFNTNDLKMIDTSFKSPKYFSKKYQNYHQLQLSEHSPNEIFSYRHKIGSVRHRIRRDLQMYRHGIIQRPNSTGNDTSFYPKSCQNG